MAGAEHTLYPGHLTVSTIGSYSLLRNAFLTLVVAATTGASTGTTLATLETIATLAARLSGFALRQFQFTGLAIDDGV